MPLSFNIQANGAYDFGQSLAFLGRSDKEALFTVQGETVYRPFAGQQVNTLLQISGIEEGVNVAVDVENLTDLGREEIIRFVNHWLDLDRDITGFYKLAASDKILAPLVDKYHGSRITCIPDFFETFCWAIAGQSISLHVVYIIKQLLVERFGEEVEISGKFYKLFPTPEKIAALETDVLQSVKLTRNKAVCIKRIAELMCSRELSAEIFSGMDTKSAVKELVKIKGIGPWTANYVMLRGLRRNDALPLGDSGLINALKNQLEMERKPTEREILEIAAGWSGWESYATFYLWRSLL
ncbi:MAG: DNA-3-methyladenine glycosylase [Melioribacteraceae bacterium]|nr:MAG: DNA-3-methyladenine glycosylase [Melioribacteraceae bacterium]